MVRAAAQDLAAQLAEVTGFDAVSLQPNSGASGEYAGLMTIRAYHQSRGDHQRNVCIIPVSAHRHQPRLRHHGRCAPACSVLCCKGSVCLHR